MIRIVRESNKRKCDACIYVGEGVELVAIGSKSFRWCPSCAEAVTRLRIRMYTEGLDSLETTS